MSVAVPAILVVGSGVSELILACEKRLRLGEKQMVARHELVGGSGLNYALRLASAGHPVLPILSVGGDLAGQRIQQELFRQVARVPALRPLRSFFDGGFFCEGLATPQSIIVTDHDQRTILTSRPRGLDRFPAFVADRVRAAEALPVAIAAVVVGHVYADGAGVAPEETGAVTRALLERFGGRALVYLNFGDSQIALGDGFWRSHLGGASVFQLSLSEARRYLGAAGGRAPGLPEILARFRASGTTAVVTLDRLGAVATFRGGGDGVVFVPPLPIDEVVDPTGAGDAFGAGVLAALYPARGGFGFTELVAALEQARTWAAHACRTLGGANDCPDADRLAEFRRALGAGPGVEVRPVAEAGAELDRLEAALG